MNKKINVFIISWPSWSWKTTIWKELEKNKHLNLSKVITTTTRTIRKDEINWNCYYFISKKKFENKVSKNEFIEYAQVYNNYYWSTIKELERIIDLWKNPVYIVDIQWMENLQKKLKNNYNIITFFIYASINKIKERLHARCTENEKNLEIRIKQISKEIKQKNNFNYKILNNKIELAINKINKIIKSYV